MQSVTYTTRSISFSRFLETAVVHRPSLLQCRGFGELKEDVGNLVSCKFVQLVTKNKLVPDQDNISLNFLEPQLKLPQCRNLGATSQVVAHELPIVKTAASKTGTVRSLQEMLGCRCSVTNGSLSGLLQTKVSLLLPSATFSTRSLADVSSQQTGGAKHESGELSSVVQVFKQPKSTLHNFYDILSAKFKNQNYKLTQNFKMVKTDVSNSKVTWSCTYCVKWPLEKCFTGEGLNKSESSTHAALQVLNWLKKAEIIDNRGRPIIKSAGEVTNPEKKAEVQTKVEKVGSTILGKTSITQPDIENNAVNCKVATVGIPKKTEVVQSEAKDNTCRNDFTKETLQGETAETLYSIDSKTDNNNVHEINTMGRSTASQHKANEKQEVIEVTMPGKAERSTRLKTALVQPKIEGNTGDQKPGVAHLHKDTKTPAKCNGEVLPGIDAAVQAIKQPKSTLHNLYVSVANELKNQDLKLHQSFHLITRPKHRGAQMKWTCTYLVKWPTEARFVGEGDNKANSAKHAALQVLSWLKGLGKITKDGLPILHSLEEVKELKKSLLECSIHEDSAAAIKGLLDSYCEDVQYILEQYKNDESCTEDDNCLPDTLPLGWTRSPLDPITGKDVITKNSIALDRRSEELSRRMVMWDHDPTEAMLSIERERSSFPIFKFRMELCWLVAENRVVVVKGEPGCGKSTQVPQFLLEHWSARGRGGHCNIIVTQPRRISAISLAKYVASQRQEKLGDVVGYQVRLNSVLPRGPGGALLFCSTGILLQRLKDNPGLIGLSHVILDEAHERDLNTDTLLVLLRRALILNPDLHVVVMSATINAELLQEYFGGASALHIPGFTYPVKQHFIEDLNIPDLKIKMETFSRPSPVIDADEVAKVINWVDKNRPPGAVLCFLPGWAEIKAVMKSLQKLNSGFGYILPLHSRLSDEDQKRIFNTPPLGLRKIILSTNIAETSLTINDVVYVVDCGAHKEERLSVNKEISSLDNQWVSQANVNQRKGRAGRVKPGESYHLYPQSLFRKMDVYPIPEVLRVPLEKTIMDIKAFSRDDRIEKFLLEMPEPPSSEAVRWAVSELIQLGVLDTDENLTSLGERILSFTTHPKLSKILIYAAIFRCLAPAMTISTLLSNDVEMFHGGLEAKEAVRKCKSDYNASSDHLALAWIYQEWENLVEESVVEPISFCQERNLNSDSLMLARKLRKLIAEHLLDAKVVRSVETCMDLDAPCNQYAKSDELVKAVLLSGFNTLLQRRSWDISGGRLKKNKNILMTESGLRATITTESVNTKRTQFSTPFLTYFRQVLSTERRATIVRETSLVSPFGILLFKPGELHVHNYKSSGVNGEGKRVVLSLKGKRTTAVICKESDAKLLEELRAVISNVTEYLIQKEGVVEHDYEYRVIIMFHDKLLHVVSHFLCCAGQAVDCGKTDKLEMPVGQLSQSQQ